MTLLEYIKVNYKGSKSDFAKAQGVQLPQVTQWLNKKFIVIEGVLHSPRRDLDSGNCFKVGSTSKSVTMNYLNDELERLLDSVVNTEKVLSYPDRIKGDYNSHVYINNTLLKVIEIFDVLYQLGFSDDEFKHLECFKWGFRNDTKHKQEFHKAAALKIDEETI